MTIEKSDLNKPSALRDGTQASRKGGTGDGNAPTAEVLDAGFSRVDEPDRAPRWLTSDGDADDLGLLGMGDGDADDAPSSGFLGRPTGFER